MYLEAKETARLYGLLTEKLGSDTAEAMFKYIDNKTERSVEATIKTLATKDDIANVILSTKDDIMNLRKDIGKEITSLRKDFGEEITSLRKDFGEEITSLRKNFGEEITSLRKDFGEEITSLRKDFGEDVANVRKEIGEAKTENIKWMFIFWVGNIGAMLTMILLLIKK